MDLLVPVRDALALAIAFALPPRCPGCGIVVAADHTFCLPCWQALDFLGGPACGQCGVPLALAFDEQARCGQCLADPPPYDRVRAAVAYGDIARALALKLKHGRRPGVARTMSRPMARLAGSLDGALIAPVPLHWRRLWARGFNQAALIARAVARATEGRLVVDLLERRKATPLLRGLNRSARAKAVGGAFTVGDRHKPLVRGRRVVLIDDVFTTGATARGCARALKRAGAAEVTVLCWARVIRDEGAAR